MITEILSALRETGEFVSGQELCEKLGVSRTAVWKGMKKLKEQGYEIESVPNKGYRLVETPDVLSEDELRSIRQTSWIGSEIVYFEETDSTNTQIKLLAEAGSPHGTYAVADRQSAGKGRRGRTWESPAKSGIFMSLLLRPDMQPNHASMLTLVAAMAVTKAIREVCHMPVQIKWPNDIVIHGKKICGILTEMSAEIEYINYIVVGIGINVTNQSFPDEIAHMATSLNIESGQSVNRAQLIEAVWEQFEHYYDIFCKTEDLSAIRKEYNSFLVNMNEQVKVLDPKEPFEGKAMGITDTGELIVDTWDSRKLVSAGEVSVRGIYGYV